MERLSTCVGAASGEETVELRRDRCSRIVQILGAYRSHRCKKKLVGRRDEMVPLEPRHTNAKCHLRSCISRELCHGHDPFLLRRSNTACCHVRTKMDPQLQLDSFWIDENTAPDERVLEQGLVLGIDALNFPGDKFRTSSGRVFQITF